MQGGEGDINYIRFDFEGKEVRWASPDFDMLHQAVTFIEKIPTIRSMLEVPRTSIDVGANIGSFSMVLSLALGDHPIVAIEPYSSTYQYLLLNTRQFPGIECMQFAAHDTREKLSLGMPWRDPERWVTKVSCGWISAHGKLEDAQEVDAMPLDEVFADREIGFIKIDVEGHEAHVIRGMSQIMTQHRPTILLEVSEENLARALQTPEEILSMMAHRGYAKAGRLSNRDWFFEAM